MKKLKNKIRLLRKVKTPRFLFRINTLLQKKTGSLALIFVVIFILSLFIAFSKNRVPFNTHLGNINLGFVRADDARHLILTRIDDFNGTPIEFDLDDKKYFSTPADLGIKIDREASSNLDIIKGRGGNARNIKTLSPFARKIVKPIYIIDYSAVASKIFEIKSSEDKNARDASIIFRSGQYQIEPEVPGASINELNTFSSLRDRVENLSNAPIIFEKYTSEPKVISAGAEKALDKMKTIAKQKILLSFGGESWKIDNEQLLSLVVFKPEGYVGDYLAAIPIFNKPVFINDIDLSNHAIRNLEVGLVSEKIDHFIENIASSIDKPRSDATLKFENGKVYEFKPAVDGQLLDRVKTKTLLLANVSVNNADSQVVVAFDLPVVIDQAKIANEEINSMGIRELIASGVSYFAGSIPNRAFNVGLGASRLSGTLVKPGEVFSFNSAVGEVSGTTGYRRAYVISEGRTVLDDGGGICQVSTTVFRAALLAGLPIISRIAHAYRVGYYEQGGFRAGVDATVWSPSVDFKFKNDTENYLLVQAIVDPVRSKLQVDIYGTRDGRRVELGKPVVTNFIPAPPDKYQDDITLPMGTTKQVDFSAAGATSVFTRKVFRSNELLIDESFRSVYKPWQAIFLVGKG